MGICSFNSRRTRGPVRVLKEPWSGCRHLRRDRRRSKTNAVIRRDQAGLRNRGKNRKRRKRLSFRKSDGQKRNMQPGRTHTGAYLRLQRSPRLAESPPFLKSLPQRDFTAISVLIREFKRKSGSSCHPAVIHNSPDLCCIQFLSTQPYETYYPVALPRLYSRISPGWQSRASQIASNVENQGDYQYC